MKFHRTRLEPLVRRLITSFERRVGGRGSVSDGGTAVVVVVVVIVVVEWYERKTPIGNVLRRRSLARLWHTSGSVPAS